VVRNIIESLFDFFFDVLPFQAPNFEFNPVNGFEAIMSTDAQYVQVIHSNGGILGMQYQSGTTDFYPNGGTRQPGT
jgi:Lipase